MINRRQAMLSTAATVVLAPITARAQMSEDVRLAGLFDIFFEDGLRLRPESATQLGLDSGFNRDLKSRLSDASAASWLSWAAFKAGS